MGQGDGLDSLRKAGLAPEIASRAWLIIIYILRLSSRQRDLLPNGAACGRFQRFWPACPSSSGRQRGQTAAFSSLPTKLTATGSTSASPGVRNVAPTPHILIANRGISRRPPHTVGSIPMKSRGRCRRPVRIAAAPAATNTLPSPASANTRLPIRHISVPVLTFVSCRRRCFCECQNLGDTSNI
jgi:hypothetical protein